MADEKVLTYKDFTPGEIGVRLLAGKKPHFYLRVWNREADVAGYPIPTGVMWIGLPRSASGSAFDSPTYYGASLKLHKKATKYRACIKKLKDTPSGGEEEKG